MKIAPKLYIMKIALLMNSWRYCPEYKNWEIHKHLNTKSFRRSFKIDVLKFCKFHTETSMLKFLFDKVAGLQTRNFLKKRLQHRCFPMKLSLIVFRWNQPLWKIHDIASINFDCFTINVSNQLKLSSEITWCHRYLF